MGLSDAAFTTPNSQSRVQCFACHRSDWFGGYNALLTRAVSHAARGEFGCDHDPFIGQISRQISVANYGERCAIPEIDLIQLPRPIARHPELVSG
jgi:hypothetical protein